MMDIIHNLYQKIKAFLVVNREDLIIVIVVITVGIVSFFIGKYSQLVLDNDNIYIVNSYSSDVNNQVANASMPIKEYVKTNTSYNDIINIDGTKMSTSGSYVYVASSRGKLYYRIGCGGSTKLSEANKLFFNTKEQAEAKGYTPAKNCAP